MSGKEGLKRTKDSYRQHSCLNLDDSYGVGLIMSLYLYFNKKWLKVGEYCKRCGEIVIYRKFQKGIPKEILEFPDLAFMKDKGLKRT